MKFLTYTSILRYCVKLKTNICRNCSSPLFFKPIRICFYSLHITFFTFRVCYIFKNTLCYLEIRSFAIYLFNAESRSLTLNDKNLSIKYWSTWIQKCLDDCLYMTMLCQKKPGRKRIRPSDDISGICILMILYILQVSL